MNRVFFILISGALLGCQSQAKLAPSNVAPEQKQVIEGAATVSGADQSSASSVASGKATKRSVKGSDNERARVLAARRKAHATRDLGSTKDTDNYAFDNKSKPFRNVRLTVRNDPRPSGFGQEPADPNVLKRQKQRGARLKVDGYRYNPDTCSLSPNYKFESFSTPDNQAQRDREKAWRPKLQIDLFDEPGNGAKPKPTLPDKPPNGVLINAGSR
ncbi:MAG: hypothetical protein P1V97_20885 [Planctomycetota bacterium]|nr:hypothetical protein [Planctomycetota bacterium]